MNKAWPKTIFHSQNRSFGGCGCRTLIIEYNQIFLYESSEEHTAFMTNRVYYYKLMSFGLISARANYQNELKRCSSKPFGLKIICNIWRNPNTPKIVCNLTPKLCFWSYIWKTLGFMVNQWGIKVNIEKIQALIEMWSPIKPKEM